MKKYVALLLALTMVLPMVGCGKKADDPSVKSKGVMTYAQYDAAAMDSEVVVETYIQAKQSWYLGAASFYTQDLDGAYFLYEMPCTQEEYNKLTVGSKIKVTGYKGEWCGEVEILEAKFEILDGNYVAPVMDATSLLGTDNLIKHQNKKVSFKGLTVEPSKAKGSDTEVAFLYDWDGSGQAGSDKDLYFNASVNGNTYTFVVEYYVCNDKGVYGADTDAYKAVQNLKIGDKVDLEGYLYWYEGANPHITSITVAK